MEVVAHGFGDLVGAFGPQVDELLAALLVGDDVALLLRAHHDLDGGFLNLLFGKVFG